MAKILYIKCGGTDIMNRHYQAILDQAALAGTEVVVTHLWRLEEEKTPFLPELPTYQGELFRVIKEAEDQGYTGVIIGCTADPGLFEAKRMVKIPVTAPLEANLHLAAIMATRVSIIVPAGVSARMRYYDLSRLYGLEHIISSIYSVDLGYPPPYKLEALMKDEPGRLLETILQCHQQALDHDVPKIAEKAISEDGATSIFCGCTLWSGMLGPLAENLKVPVLDPVIGSLRLLEAADDFVRI